MGSTLLVNAEVDSMGGVIDSGVGNATKTSPHHVAIEEAQAELRLEYDVREERRRELEFLEKGGNPLDYRSGVAASVSVQSTSFTDQLRGQYVNSEAKSSFALATSPRGDSVESSGRLGAAAGCDPNSADNFDGENELIENGRKSTFHNRSRIAPSDRSSQLHGIQNFREAKNSSIFHPKKAYRRRNRSKTNRGGLSSSLPSSRAVVSDAVMLESPSDTEAEVAHGVKSVNTTNKRISEGMLDVSAPKHFHSDKHNQNVRGVGVPAATTGDSNSLMESEKTIPGECPPSSGPDKPELDAGPEQLDKSNQLQIDDKGFEAEGVVNNAVPLSKGLDSESSCTQTSISIEGNGNVDSEPCTSMKNVNSTGEQNEQKAPTEQTANSKDEMVLEDRKTTCAAERSSCVDDNDIPHDHPDKCFPAKEEEKMKASGHAFENEAKSHPNSSEVQSDKHDNTVTDKGQGSREDSIPKELGCCPEKPQGLQDPSIVELNKTDTSAAVLAPELQTPVGSGGEVVDRAYEDQILEEARVIEVKRKRLKELSVGPPPKEYRRKSHWDFVLEEMAWMANDFAQERVWKRTAAAQLSHRAAIASRSRLDEKSKLTDHKVLAQSMAKAVMGFWHSAGVSQGETIVVSNGIENGKVSGENMDVKCNTNGVNGNHEKDSNGKDIKLPIQRYALQFMQHNSSDVRHLCAEVSQTPERASVVDMPEMASSTHSAEEDLFYIVPHGAMAAYRKSIEVFIMQCEKAGINMQEEVDASMAGAWGVFESQENDCEEDEGESMYYLPGTYEGHRPKFVQKKQKNPKSYTHKSYQQGGDFSYGHCVDHRNGTSQSAVVGKRPSNGLTVGSIPTKRMRTASRQRIVSPFSFGGAGTIPAPTRADASSGDTSSYQDEQSTMHGGSFIHKGVEVESGMEVDKQSAFAYSEMPVQPKKKKKAKHQGGYDQRWQVDGNTQSEQKEYFKKRTESHQFESNGSGGPFAPHSKKPKTMKQSLDDSFDNAALMSGSAASAVGSQLSNMSNSNRLIKLISVRDRGRKAKALKMPSGQTGPGSPWSLFEDQALVVLVHDMGPNWELVSDAINSTLRFKCIFRNPKECKERHKVLIEKSCGDGADSADDSGSSQPYPSTLPGIPKGGARQLFQQLRGPIEEDTIKSHFEKIIILGQQLHGRKKRDSKQLVTVHGSHLAALSQAIPNNLNGGVLTPLDLCDIAASSPDVFLNYQGPSGNALPLANQGTSQSMHPSGTNSPHPGSPAVGLGGNMASPSAQISGPGRDGRLVLPRSSLPIDEQQRTHQYNQILSGRNVQQPNMPAAGAFSGNDRGVRILPGGNGMVMPGMSRSVSLPRQGHQGVSSPSKMNSGSVAASNIAAMPSSMNVHSVASPGQANSTLRPRDASRMPSQNPEHQMQMMSPEIQYQATQARARGVTSFGGLNSTFPNQSASPSAPYASHHQQQHQISQQQSTVLNNSHHPHPQGPAHPPSAEQQAFAIRIARERQLQHRMLQRQQHQQFSSSNALPPSSSQSASPPSLTSSSQLQQKHQLQQHHGLGRVPHTGTGGMMNQGGKQRQSQATQLQHQLQQSARHHLPQRQPSQSQQPAKLSKGMGKGNMSMHPNVHADSSHVNGLSGNPGKVEKGEQNVQQLQGQGFVTQPSKSAAPASSNQSHPQQKRTISGPISSKLVHRIPSHPDGTRLSQVPPVTSASSLSASNESLPLPSHNQQQLKVHPSPQAKSVNQPTIQRSVSDNCVVNSDRLTEPQNDQSKGDQHSNNTSPVSTTSRIMSESTTVAPDASTASPAHAKTPDQMSDSVIPVSSNQISSCVSRSAGNEAIGSSGKVLGQRQHSGSLLSRGHVDRKWQQQQQLQQPPHSQALLSQKQSQQQQVPECSPQIQPLVQQHPQL